MATKLYFRATTDNAITDTGDGILYDMITTAGTGVAPLAVVNTAASGTEIQWTDTAGGATVAWISGRAPSGGFTLTTTDISIWARESNMNANCGGRYRVFKRTAAGSVSELGGGPFNDGVEFGTGPGEFTWIGNVTDTAFAEDDRILIRVYITNIGTMASGHTCSLDFGAPDASQGDSFFNIAETVTFKAEEATVVTAAAHGRAQGRGTATGDTVVSTVTATAHGRSHSKATASSTIIDLGIAHGRSHSRAIAVPVLILDAALGSRKAYDTFTRVVSNGWGTPEVGGAYTTSHGIAGADFDVNGAQGTWTHTAGLGAEAWLSGTQLINGESLSAFKIPVTPSGGNAFFHNRFRCQDQNSNRYTMRVQISSGGGTMVMQAQRIVAASATNIGAGTNGPTFAADTYFLLRTRWESLPNSQLRIRAKVWERGTTQPDWQLDETDTAERWPNGGSLGVSSGTTGSVVPTFTVDEYEALVYTPLRGNGRTRTSAVGANIVSATAQGKSHSRGTATATPIKVARAHGRSHTRATATSTIIDLGVAHGRSHARGTAAATIIDLGQVHGRAHSHATATGETLVSTVTAEAHGRSRSRSTLVGVRQISATAFSIGRGRSTTTALQSIGVASASRGRSRSTLIGDVGGVHTAQAHGRARTRATLAALNTSLTSAQARGRGKGTARGDIAGIVLAIAQGRSHSRATTSGLITVIASTQGRSHSRSTTATSATISAAARGRARGRSTSAAVPITIASAQGRSHSRATASSLRIVPSVAHGRARARGTASVIGIRISSAHGRARSRATSTASQQISAAAQGRGRSRGTMLSAALLTTSAHGFARGRARVTGGTDFVLLDPVLGSASYNRLVILLASYETRVLLHGHSGIKVI